MRPSYAYDAIVRRVTGYLEQGSRAREAQAWSQRRSPKDPVVFIVAERNMPYPFAPLMYAHWLEWIAQNDPDLRTKIEVAHLPANPPPNTAVLHAWVQDPVRERSGALFGHLQELQTQVTDNGAQVIQPVEVLSNSLREVQYERLTSAGVRTPRVAPIDTRFARDLAGLTPPIIVRRNWGHQHAILRLDSHEQVAQWLQATGPNLQDWVAAECVEVRDSDGNYRKYRYVMFGDCGVCRHLIVSPNWEVRPKDRILTDETIAEELAFVGGPCAQHALLDAARRELGFDIAAFDYSFDDNGEMIVWEVNPYPDLSRPKGRPGEYLGESMRRSNEALAALYRDRLAAAH